MKATRGEVYSAIDGERAYQDAGKGNAQRHEGMPKMSPGEFILCMEHCLAEARRVWYAPDGGVKCLEHLRKVSALGVQAMELYGAPERAGYSALSVALRNALPAGVTKWEMVSTEPGYAAFITPGYILSDEDKHNVTEAVRSVISRDIVLVFHNDSEDKPFDLYCRPE